MAKNKKKSKVKRAARTSKATAERAEQPKPISREVIRHPDGSIETVVIFEGLPDWRESAAKLAELDPEHFGGD